MPTYVYQCTSCGKEFENTHGMSKEPEVLCPECGARAERRITGGAGFIMKSGDSVESCCGIDSPCKDPKRCCER
ncbi:zinc ribbon domain-containing protein [candidate division WOR-3 bacterium]|uniref:Zinc ribbon domain-containing protein n=1 Tax=candidate division WOR-3 bacterium TaxID=2052148 RepID=A0A9D5KCC7_UNCW3|nr:zinc ribbon domain-containing protein [candidate division WOR-3 bacterium]MBD3365470.1 zinc ribbon domain-containing protein [candidate division WOR-3 bacterium]